MDPAEVASIQNSVYDVTISRYAQLAAVSLAVYDHVITFGEEYNLVWQKRLSSTKLLFLAFRYLGLAVNVSDGILFLSTTFSRSNQLKTCYQLLLFQSWGTCTVIWLSQIILQGRVWALHNCSRKILACLLFLFVSEITAMAVILGVSIPQIQYTDEPLPGFKVCTATSTPKSFFTFWIPSLAFESSLLFFAVWGGLKSYLDGERKFDSEKLAHVIVRDNILYFFATFSIYLINAVVWLAAPVNYIEIPEGFSVAITCIVGARLMLNLRSAYYKPNATQITTGADGGLSALRELRVNRPKLAVSTFGYTLPSPTDFDLPIPLQNLSGMCRSPSTAKLKRPVSHAEEDHEPELGWRWDDQTGSCSLDKGDTTVVNDV